MSEHHILVIDDDERLRVLLRRFLETGEAEREAVHHHR